MKRPLSNKTSIPLGPYSQYICSDNYVFTSGQIGINPSSGKLINNNFDDQLLQILENISKLLEESGSSFNKIIKITIYLTDLSNFNELNSILSMFYENKDFDNLPARSTVQVSRLPKDALIEIDVVAKL